jgi:hypothetical protein
LWPVSFFTWTLGGTKKKWKSMWGIICCIRRQGWLFFHRQPQGCDFFLGNNWWYPPGYAKGLCTFKLGIMLPWLAKSSCDSLSWLGITCDLTWSDQVTWSRLKSMKSRSIFK